MDITDQLDPDLDWSTFQWTGFGFGDNTISIPANTQHYETTLPMTYDGVTFRVVVTLDLNPLTGMVHASFQSLNAANLMTGLATCPGTLPLGPPNPDADLPPSVLIGFLPPENGTGRGMGNITYTVRPKAGLTTGTQIRKVADVTFDLGNTIATDQVSETDPTQGVDPSKQALVTIDAVPPTSSVAALPAYLTTNTFTVSWSGSDDPGGSGIGSYTVYVSDDGGPYSPWQTATTQTSATYTGVDGHTYRFFSLATDNAGNLQPVPTSAQATTAVDITTPTSTVAALPAFSPGSFTLTWSGSNANGLGIASYDVYVSKDGGAFTPLLTGTTSTSTTFTGTNNDTYAFYSVATDVVGKHQPTPTNAQATTKVDAVAPTSSVAALPPTSLPTFTLSWSGSDNPGGSGLASYDIYVSDNSGSFTRWLTATTATSAPYTGVNGHTYGFFSVAKDNVGNAEAMPTSAQATTLVKTNLNFQVTSSIAHPVYGQSQFFEADLSPAGSGLPTPTGTIQFLIDGATFGSPVTLVNGVADTPSLSALRAGSHVITASYSGNGYYTPGAGDFDETVAKATLIVTADDKTKLYGAALPGLTFAYTGFVNGENAGSVNITGVPSLSTSASMASSVGSYSIQVDTSLLASNNYSFLSGTPGSLTVTPASLTLIAYNKVKTQGSSNPALTYTITGFVNGDNASVVSGTVTLGTTATAGSTPGLYPINFTSVALTATNYIFPIADQISGTLTVNASTVLSVTTFVPTTTGFTASFDEAFNPSTLNLYTTATSNLGPADVTLVGATTGQVYGSLIVDPTDRFITFIQTGGILAPDTYTLTLRSATNGFVDANGNLLDGDNDGTPGGDYTVTFTVAPSSARVISIPDFARGPGQVVNIPATAAGLPLRISDGTGVTSLSLTLTYNPALLTITGVNLGASAPAGSSVSVDTSTPGTAIVTFNSPTALPAGLDTFAALVASVPATATYTSKEALVIGKIVLNGGAISATDDDGVHVVDYIGDAAGFGGYSSLDVTMIRRVLVGRDTGFAAFPLADPTIIADIANLGTLSSLDVTYLSQYLVGFDQPRIPDIPDVNITYGPDPRLWIPQTLSGTPGSTLTVPVLFRQTNATTIALDAAEVAIGFDPSIFTVTGVRLGDVPKGFTLTERIDNTTGEIIVSARSTGGAIFLEPGFEGTLLLIDLTIRPGAPLGALRINLLGNVRLGNRVFSTSLNDGNLTLTPAPTDSDLDPVDGVVTIFPPAVLQLSSTPLNEAGSMRATVVARSPQSARVMMSTHRGGPSTSGVPLKADSLYGLHLVAPGSLDALNVAIENIPIKGVVSSLALLLDSFDNLQFDESVPTNPFAWPPSDSLVVPIQMSTPFQKRVRNNRVMIPLASPEQSVSDR